MRRLTVLVAAALALAGACAAGEPWEMKTEGGYLSGARVVLDTGGITSVSGINRIQLDIDLTQANQPVEFLPPLHQKRVVRDLVSEGMLEHIGQLGKEALFVDQLNCLEISQKVLSSFPDLCQPVDQAAGKLSPDNRGDLERLFGRLC